MGNTAFFRMDLGTAQLFHGGHFIDNRFHHIRAGYEHLGGILHHENEITDGGRITGAAGAGARITAIWGITPEALVWRRNIPA